MKNIPEKIYLQVGADDYDIEDFNDLREVTWCQDQIHSDDLVYKLVKSENRKWLKGGNSK